VQQAWDAVRSALNSPSRVLTAAQRNYVNQIDILLEEWVQFREAKFAIDWTELREAVRDLLSEAGISAPEPMDMSIEDNEPTAWRAAFSGISGK
jgi:hypothetical protein